MIAFIRSLDGFVSNAYDSGAIWTLSALRGTDVADPVARVLEVEQQHADVGVGLVAEQLLRVCQRIQVRPARVWDQDDSLPST